MNKIDLELVLNEEDGLYDIDFDTDGDFLMSDGIETAIIMTVLSVQRADESEVTKAIHRRGDWSNELNEDDEFEVGSKLWLLEQARVIQESLNNGIGSLESAFQWMVEDNIIKEVIINGEIIDNSMKYTIELTKQNSETETFLYDAFANTINRVR